MDISALKVEPGQSVGSAWKKLKRWARGFKPIAGSRNVRLNMIPGQGTYVTVSYSLPSFIGSFFVTLKDETATVGAGTISEAQGGTFIPYIGADRIDGIQGDGDQGTVPTFEINGGPNSELQSWIVIQLTVDQSTGTLDTGNPMAVQIAHVNDLTPPKNNLIGQQEIAMLRWSDKSTIAEVFQIVRHNLKHQFVAATKGGASGRHFFYAV